MYSLTLAIISFLFTGVLVSNSFRFKFLTTPQSIPPKAYYFSAQRNVDFIMSAVVAVSFIYCHVIPYFVDSMKVFEVLTTVLLLIGAAVGGMVGLLIPYTTTGLILGFLVGVFIDAATYGVVDYGTAGSVISISIFVCTLISFCFLVHVKENQFILSALRTAITIGLVFTLSIDFLLDGGLLNWIASVVRISVYDSSMCFADCHIPALLATWAVATSIIFLYHLYKSGVLKSCFNRMRGRSSSRHFNMPYEANGSTSSLLHDSKSGKQKTFSYPDALEYNYFDPDNIPLALQPYSDIVFSEVQRLMHMYGFQVDSSRNQSEHLLMMLTNEIDKLDFGNLRKPVVRIHTKLFSNYRKWCKHVGAPILLSNNYTQNKADLELDDNATENDQRYYAPLISDILLWLLIWGEAGNMKHLPESLCFLYHKSVCELKYFNENEMYYGFYLDMVITPIYEVIASALTKKGDHNDKKTYDDFNEFFWSPNCLNYGIIEQHNYPEDAELGSRTSWINQGHSDEIKIQHVAQGMAVACKTYVEKRSWFHPLLNLRRVFEWHAVTFTILASWAFSNQLVWNISYTLKVGSFVFWEISVLTLLWTCLEVWVLIPNAVISGPSKCGYLIRLFAGYLLLIYQTVYYHWSFPTEGKASNPQGIKEDPNFWWWQYVWISLIALTFYILETFMCLVPFVTSKLLSFNDDIVQALLNICFPFSQLYVGKVVHVSQTEVIRYAIFWVSVIGWKFWFSYHFIVFPVTVPSLELYDDYVNFGEVSFMKTALLFFVWWFPHFLVYLIDLSIWYSLWSSAVGGFIALVDRQGAVRENKTFRTHFMKSPIAFCQKLMPSTSRVSSVARNIAASTASITNIAAITPLSHANKATPTKVSGVPRATLNKNKKMQSTGDLLSLNGINSQYQASDFSSSAGFDTTLIETPDTSNSLKGHLSSVLTDVGQRWEIFATVWNEIIDKLRATDHLNNAELDNYVFSIVNDNWLSKSVYLPLFQTVGCVETSIYAFKQAATDFLEEKEPIKKVHIIEEFHTNVMDLSMKEAVNETWELASWILTSFMGHVHSDDLRQVLQILEAWAYSSTGDLFVHIKADGIQTIINNLSNITGLLKSSIGKRKKENIVTKEVIQQMHEIEKSDKLKEDSLESSTSMTSHGLKKSVSTGFLTSLNQDNKAIVEPSGPSTSSFTRNRQNTTSQNNRQRFAKLQPFSKGFVLQDITRDKIREEVKLLLGGLRNLLRNVGNNPKVKSIIDGITFVLKLESGFLWNDLYASEQLDQFAKNSKAPGAVNKLYGLLKLRQTQVDTLSPEPTRRLNFFINSLFMDMPLIPQTRFSKDFSTLTPYYGEDIILTKDDLESKNSDEISTILYLQTLYKKDWHNFLERRKITDDQAIWSAEHIQETRMWASLRAQTLFRTVDGMMYTEAAIRLVAQLEQLPDNDIDLYAKLKFNYVVACQIYGEMKKNMDHKAEDIEFLLDRHPNLRVVYIDAVRATRDGEVTYYSVLVKSEPAMKTKSNKYGIKEVYRIKLAGNPVLGEGKPENQNHAVIFTRGRFLQAIDMNQDGYFEEALKMRNLLQEFDSGITILGFREHIFTGSVSSVANYMALQELSFVTLGQRVLATPLCIRQHYGHPDIFDKFFTMTEGGMSKASKGINLSEDVFAGFNATIRGHTVGFKEYAQVGKGRDVGLQQTYKFEAKLAQGNAEQSLSRDLSRVCDRLDFFRMMSFYYGGIGHYIANTMVMFTLVVVVYFMVGLAVFNEEGVNGRPMHPEGVLQLLMAGLGLLQTMPLIVTLTVEKGFITAVTEIGYMFLSGGPLYFIFHIQTKCYYFSQTLMTGGAAYRPTGRGFVIRHSPFDENYRFFATSHIYLGFELMVALILFAIHTDSKQYSGLTWSLWLTSVSFMFGPFWFNPITFEWNKLKEDYLKWIKWMAETGGSSDLSWAVWWREENSFYKDLSFSWKVFIFVQKFCVWFFLAVGVCQARFFRDQDEQKYLVELLTLFVLYLASDWIISKLERSLTYAARRFASLVLNSVIAGTIVYWYCIHTLYIRYSVALYYLISAICSVCLLAGFTPVSAVYKLHDYLVGHVIFIVLGILAIFQFGYLQTWLLYHNALSAGVVMDDILKYARKTKERGVVDGQDISTLRHQLLEQERLIKQLAEALHFNEGDLSNFRTPSGMLYHNDEKSSLLKSKHGNHSNGIAIGSALPSAAGVSKGYGSIASTPSINRFPSGSSKGSNSSHDGKATTIVPKINSSIAPVALAQPVQTQSLNLDLSKAISIASESSKNPQAPTSPEGLFGTDFITTTTLMVPASTIASRTAITPTQSWTSIATPVVERPLVNENYRAPSLSSTPVVSNINMAMSKSPSVTNSGEKHGSSSSVASILTSTSTSANFNASGSTLSASTPASDPDQFVFSQPAKFPTRQI